MTICVSDREVMEQSQESEIVLSVEGVSKKFCRDLKSSLFYGIQDITKELTGLRENSHKLRPHEFWAVNNVGFQLRRGEALGLVGPNGSGKTTLLRIISGLIKPDTGRVKVRGKIAPLIALGAGFNPILTGRENIYANMSILGLSKAEIDAKFDAVVDFAEIDEAIDAPVQTYSSGMAARLGFASAVHTEPDILLIDEVLAVGDIKFRSKCFKRLHKLQKNGTSFLLVSHNPYAILSVCDSAIYILRGSLVSTGDACSIMQQYEEDLFLDRTTTKFSGTKLLVSRNKSDNAGIDITSIYFRDKKRNIIEEPVCGQSISLSVNLNVNKKINGVDIKLRIDELFGGETILLLSTMNTNESLDLCAGSYEISAEMPYLCLKPSHYLLKVQVSQGLDYILDQVENCRFKVGQPKEVMSKCSFYQPRTWKVIENIKD